MCDSPIRMDDVRVFLSTQIEVWKTGDLVPKLYIWWALEASPFSSTNVGVLFVVSTHDRVEGFVVEMVFLTMESKDNYSLHNVPYISGEKFECWRHVYACRKLKILVSTDVGEHLYQKMDNFKFKYRLEVVDFGGLDFTVLEVGLNCLISTLVREGSLLSPLVTLHFLLTV